MGAINISPPVKLIIGFIFSEGNVLENTLRILKRRFGPTDYESQIMPFTHTDYYDREMGKGLKRKFIAFQRLIRPEKLCAVKVFTNRIEAKFSKGGLRLINIDCGYVDLAKLVLASTKDFRHRLYLGKGIFAEITLFYQDKSYHYWDWTFPDYRTQDYINIFNEIRRLYHQQL